MSEPLHRPSYAGADGETRVLATFRIGSKPSRTRSATST